jgi:hypothetical protein
MIIINFAHPISDAQREQVAALAGQPIERVIDVKTQFDHARPFVEQVEAVFTGMPIEPDEWQTAPLVLNLPSLAPIAAIVLAELHGRMGYFPSVLRLRPVAGSNPPSYEVAEIVQLQTVRDAARARR